MFWTQSELILDAVLASHELGIVFGAEFISGSETCDTEAMLENICSSRVSYIVFVGIFKGRMPVFSRSGGSGWLPLWAGLLG